MRPNSLRGSALLPAGAASSTLLRGLAFGVVASLSLGTSLAAVAAAHAPIAKNDSFTVPIT